MNAPFDHKKEGDQIVLSFEAPQRVFHVEFYDPIATGKSERSYTYTWAGDFAADQLEVAVQEPAGSSKLTTQPALEASTQGPDGLRYRSGTLGALSRGKSLPIKLAYTKTDKRNSVDILPPKPQASAPTPAGDSMPAMPRGEPSLWLIVLGIALPAILAAGLLIVIWRRRESSAEAVACPKCGTSLRAGDRFCSKCGASLK